MLAFLACVARHGWSHRCFQFLFEHSYWFLWTPCPQGQWNRFLVICIIELWFFICPFMLLPQVCISCHSSPEFRPYTIWLGSHPSSLFSSSWDVVEHRHEDDPSLHPTAPWFDSRRVSRSTTGCSVLSCNSYFFNMANALLLSFFLDLLQSCSSTWRCAYEHFSSNLQPLLVLSNKHPGGCHFVQNELVQVPLR